jgi:protein-S-isoprenylcysteine O-methyltransferase Ste14
VPALLSFLYGVGSYAVTLLTLLYLVGFSADWGVPKSVDSGGGGPVLQAVATDLLLIALFGVQHSVMARAGFKRGWTRVIAPALERSTFMLAACAVLATMFWFWVPIPTVVWRADAGVPTVILWSLFGLGWLLVLLSTFLIDHFELFGLRQVYSRLVSRPLPEPRLMTPLVYRHVRHPLYLGFLITFWAVPVMTAGRLLFAAGFTAYILIGIAFEERDLVRQFGDRYRLYREQVGMLLPRWSWTSPAAGDGAAAPDASARRSGS